MVDRAPETYEEIAARTGRPITTVRNTWSRHPEWPHALKQRRGRANQYDPDAVDAFIRAHIDRSAIPLEPRRLYTAREIEALTGITAATIRADRSRNRWPEPDNTEGGAHRWYGSTITTVLAGRRGYRRSGEGT